MATSGSDAVFAGSVPQLYERYLVPLIFQPYAVDLAERVAAHRPKKLLEIAAGTGVATREFAKKLAADCEIVATDLNPAMIEQASRVGTSRPVQWRQADGMQLPFEDAHFDAVACQYGVMFYPDRARGYAESRRVLRPGGLFAFNVWDAIEHNEFAAAVADALARVFPDDPPRFMARTPHGYHQRERIEADLVQGGFTGARIDTVTFPSRAASARDVAIAYCQGTPWRGEIEARGGPGLEGATDAAAEELARRFGAGPVEGKIQAHVVTVTR
jgi:SAM-dependent methyltransferase